MKLRLWLIPLTLILSLQLVKAQSFINNSDFESTDIIDPEFLDGFVSVGGGFLQHLKESALSGQDDKGVRQYAHLEFTRLRRWIALDFRAGFGNGYNDYGLIFKVYKHWRFNPKNSTGLSLGAGLGAMYSPKKTLSASLERPAFLDFMGAPFARYMWDWGNGVGIEASLEYQLLPLRKSMGSSATNQDTQDSSLRSRIAFGVSLLFEAD